MSRSWCNFCEENHEDNTCEVKKSARDKIFGNNPETTIVVLDWEELEDVMIINTRNKSYAPKGKYDPPHASSTPTSSSQGTNVLTFPRVKEFLPLLPLPSITSLTNWLISRSMLLFWTWLSSLNNKIILGILWKENIPP